MLCIFVACMVQTSLMEPPETRIGFSCAAVGAKVCIVGGVNHGAAEDPMPQATFVFDTAAGDPAHAWEIGPSIGRGFVLAGAASVGERVFVIGGAGSGDEPSAAAGMLDMKTGAWLDIPPMPTPRSRLSVVAIENAVYAIGGLGEQTQRPNCNLAAVERFDVAAGAWAPCPTLLDGRHACAAAALDGCIYVTGGYVGAGHEATASVEKFDPALGTWVNVAPMTHARAFHTAAAVEGRLYVFGSRTRGDASRTYEVFDPTTNRWTTGEMPEERHRNGIAVVAGRIWLLGGEGAEGDASPWVRWFENGDFGP